MLLEPSTVALDIGESREFSAEAFDAYGNPIPEAQITWEATPRVGAIADDGLLTAGTSADTVREAVRVTAVLGSGSAESSASVTVQPDPLDSVTLASIAISAGDGRQLQARATDQYGNIVTEVRMTWAVLDSNTGSATETGLFTAGEVEISLTDAVQVQVTQGETSIVAEADVATVPGPLEQVVIAPDQTVIGMEMTQQFVAVGADQYGNRIPELTFTWSVEAGGGAIDSEGIFVAGTEPTTTTRP